MVSEMPVGGPWQRLATPLSYPAMHNLVRHLATLLVLGVACTTETRAAWRAQADGTGRLTALSVDGEFLPIRTDLRIALPGWNGAVSATSANVTDAAFAVDGSRRTWSGRLPLGDGTFCAFRQVLTENDGAAQLEMTVTAEADLAVEGAFLFVNFPVSGFRGTPCVLRNANQDVASERLPPEVSTQPRFLTATASRVLLNRDDPALRLEITFDQSRALTVQDERHWNGDSFAIFTPLVGSTFTKGQSATLRVTLAATGTANHAPATLTVKPRRKLYTFDGVGGNFVYNLDSPVVPYALDNLRVAWARVQMSLREWEPENDNDDPADTAWPTLEARDEPGSHLRSEFEMAQRLQQRGIPLCISVWQLPEWLYADPGRGPDENGRRIAADKKSELLESIGSYLLYARRQYGVEPKLFSFNEPDLGVRVLLSPGEYGDMVKDLGAHFARLGLKTKVLLADVANPRDSDSYIVNLASDNLVKTAAGAVAFHSWGGATPAQLKAWGKVATDLELPLLVTEVGTNPSAWRTPWEYQTFAYAIQELRLLQELLLYARPQSLLEWELTGDYATVLESKDATGQTVLKPSWRFWFLKHLATFTPPQADALATTSNQENVLFTAFSGRTGGEPRVYTFHIANLGAGRVATVGGLPLTLDRFRVIATTEAETFQELPPVAAVDGTLTLDLPSLSLLTLTTVRAPAQSPPVPAAAPLPSTTTPLKP